MASLASAEVPARSLSHRTITLSLIAGSRFADYGYEVATVPDLTLTLTRIRVRKVSGARVLGGNFGIL